jgi:hypothetical protein
LALGRASERLVESHGWAGWPGIQAFAWPLRVRIQGTRMRLGAVGGGCKVEWLVEDGMVQVI